MPLLGVRRASGDRLIGSNFGQAHHPAWVHNLRADPRARVAPCGGEPRDVVAEEVESPERERYLALAGRGLSRATGAT